MRPRVLSGSTASCLVVVALVVAACGGRDPGKTPSGAKASCAADSECVVSDKAHCCETCPSQPFAIPELNAAQLANKCAEATCGGETDRVECPKVDPKDAFVAICKEGTCAVKKK